MTHFISDKGIGKGITLTYLHWYLLGQVDLLLFSMQFVPSRKSNYLVNLLKSNFQLPDLIEVESLLIVFVFRSFVSSVRVSWV